MTSTGPSPGVTPCLSSARTEHGRIAGGADRHGLGHGEGGLQRNQPFALEPSLLREATAVRLADAPTVQHHLVAGLPVGVVRGLDHAREVNARDHGKAADHGAFAGDRQRILVVQGGAGNPNRHVALGQRILAELG